MKRSIRKILLILGVMCLVFGFCMLSACNSGNDAETEVTTAAETEVGSDTEVTTENNTEDTTTEEITTEEKETLPEGSPTDANVITFCDMEQNATILSASNAASYEIVNDEALGSVLKLSVTSTKRNAVPYVKIDYANYMKLAGLDPTAWSNCAYAVLQVKLEGVSNVGVNLTATGRVDNASKNITGTGNYNKLVSDWQYVLIPLAEEEGGEGMLLSLRFDFIDSAKNVGETVYLKSITLFDNKLEAVETMGINLINPSEATVVIPGLTKEYTFLHITDTHVSAYSDADKNSWTTTRLNYNIARRASFVANGLYAEERFPMFFDYAEKIGADGMFLTGDLVDFPSEKNVAMLYNNATRISGNAIFCLGNHDWNYSDDYMTSNAYATYKPLFSELCGGDPDIAVVEYDEFIVVAIDNSADMVTQETVDKFFALYEKNKPIILLLHVPLHVDTLAPDVMNAWGGRNITMGIGAMGEGWQSVRDLYTSVCLDENTPVVAVFAGHVHFNHVDTFPNGVTQYVTNAGYFGDCRVVTVKGTN